MSLHTTISVKKEWREGYPGEIVYANLLMDGKPLTEYEEIHQLDFVSCLGWGPIDYQQEQINRLLLHSNPDLNDNRYSLYVCPCTDLGCGAVSLKIEIQGDFIVWSDFGVEDTLEYRSTFKIFEGIGPFYFRREDYEEVLQSTLLLGEPSYWHSDKW